MAMLLFNMKCAKKLNTDYLIEYIKYAEYHNLNKQQIELAKKELQNRNIKLIK